MEDGWVKASWKHCTGYEQVAVVASFPQTVLVR